MGSSQNKFIGAFYYGITVTHRKRFRLYNSLYDTGHLFVRFVPQISARTHSILGHLVLFLTPFRKILVWYPPRQRPLLPDCFSFFVCCATDTAVPALLRAP